MPFPDFTGTLSDTELPTSDEHQISPAPARNRKLWRQFSMRKVATAGLIGFLIIVGIAILAPLIAPHDPLKQNLGDNFKPPMWKEGGTSEYPLGTDPLGRDLLSRLIYGARYSLAISLGAVIVGGFLGFLTVSLPVSMAAGPMPC